MDLILCTRQKGVLVASGVLIVIGSIILSIGLPILFDLTQFGKTPKCFQELNCRYYGISDFVIVMQNGTYFTVHGSVDFKTSEVFSEANPIQYEFRIIGDQELVKEVYMLIDDEKKDFGHFNGVTKDKLTLSLIHDNSEFSNYRAIQLQHYDEFVSKDELVFFNTGKLSTTLLIVDADNVVHTSKRLDGIFDLAPFESKMNADEIRQDKNSNQQMLALTWIGLGLAFMLLAGDFVVRVVLND